MDRTLDVLKSIVAERLTRELNDEESFSAEKLLVKVEMAIDEVRSTRNYQATSYTEEQIVEDLFSYISVITNLARYDYNQIGAEGEKSHSENGISRTYISRDDLLKGVHPFVKLF